MAHWPYYGDNIGALVDTAYAKHAAHLPHRVTHNHPPEVREAAAIHINEAQTARKACPRWILTQQGVLTSVGTSIWAQLQLVLPHHTHTILMNHHCDQQGRLVATYTDVHRHPAGEVDTLRLVEAAINIVYIPPLADESHGPVRSPPRPVSLRPAIISAPHLRSIPPHMCHESRAQNARTKGYQHGVQGLPTPAPPTPPERARSPQRRRHEAGGAHPVSGRLDTTHHHAASALRAQRRYRTVRRHHTPCSIPKHNAPERDVPPVRRDDQGIPRMCWQCNPAALDVPWPQLHLISTHYDTPSAAATADQHAGLSPLLHTVSPGHPAHVAWTRTPAAAWTFTSERVDQKA